MKAKQRPVSVDVKAFTRQFKTKNDPAKDAVLRAIAEGKAHRDLRQLQGTAYTLSMKSQLRQKVDVSGKSADEVAEATTHSGALMFQA